MTATSKINLRHKSGTNWIVGTVYGLEVQAKVYDEPSQFGMELDRRISKLWVRSPGFGVLYNYDRGLDFDLLNTEGLTMVVAAVARMIR